MQNILNIQNFLHIFLQLWHILPIFATQSSGSDAYVNEYLSFGTRYKEPCKRLPPFAGFRVYRRDTMRKRRLKTPRAALKENHSRGSQRGGTQDLKQEGVTAETHSESLLTVERIVPA